MGHTVAEVRLYSPRDLTKHLVLELLVDTGSTYAWVKRDKLEKLDVKPMTKWKFKTIEGKIIEREIGEAPIECLDERATTIAQFAEDGDAEVLGVYTLEGLRLEVDPTTKQLRRTGALLALI
jgi:predicted aspartyl protease